MASISFSDGIGVGGLALTLVVVVLDKAGKLKGGWLFGLLFCAGAMTLFLALGNSWVMEAPARWKLWRGALMFSLVAFTYTGAAIWIYGGESEQQSIVGSPSGSAPTGLSVSATGNVEAPQSTSGLQVEAHGTVTPPPSGSEPHSKPPKPPVRAHPNPEAAATPPQQPITTQNAPGGINIGRDNFGNLTVNNYGALPPKPLVLTDEQSSTLTAALRKFSGQSLFLHVSGTMVNDPFGERLKGVMEAAGLTVRFNASYAVVAEGIGTPPPGISCSFGKNRTDILYALSGALKDLQIVDKPMNAVALGDADKVVNVFGVFVTSPQ